MKSLKYETYFYPTHENFISTAAGLLQSGDKDHNDVPNITDYDWELPVDLPPPAPGDSDPLSTSTHHRFTAAQHEKARQTLSHHVGNTAFKPTHHDPIIAAPGACIWTEASDIAVGGEPVFDSSFDSLCNQMYATAGNINTAEYALTDSGCGKSTIPNDSKYTCNLKMYGANDDRYSVQAAQGSSVAATGICDWIICWNSETPDGWVLKCMVTKALIIPGSMFYMIATGAEGIGYKGSPLSFVDNVNSTGKPGIWQADLKRYEHLTTKWKVPVVKMIDLPLDMKKTLAHNALVIKRHKGILTLNSPSPTMYETGMERETWADYNCTATGGQLEDCEKAYDRLVRINTHLESELMKFKDRTGDVDPLAFAHYLIGHRHPQTLRKAVESGQVINCDIDLQGSSRFKVKACIKCTLATARELPCGKRQYSKWHKSQEEIADTAAMQQVDGQLSAESRRYLLKHTGYNLAKQCGPYAVIVLDEITGTGATMIDESGSHNVNNIMVATCLGYNLRHAYGQVDMSAVTLEETLKTIIAWVKAHGCRCLVFRFDPSGQAKAKSIKSICNDLGVHIDLTSPKVKNEAAMAEGSNAIYNHACRVNLGNILTTSDSDGGRDKRWRHKFAFLAGRYGLNAGNCLWNQSAGHVPMSKLLDRPIDFKKMFPGPFACVCIFRDHNAGNKTEDRGQFGLFGGVIKSATHEDQIIVITLPEFEKAGELTRIMGRSRVTCFPLEQDPLTVFFKFAGTVPNYLKDMLTDKAKSLTVSMERLIREHIKTGDEYSTDIDDDERSAYEDASSMIDSHGPIPTEYATADSMQTVDVDLQAIQPGNAPPVARHEEPEQPSIGERVQVRTDRNKTTLYEPEDHQSRTKRYQEACKPKRQSTLPSTDALQDYVLQKTSTTGNVKVPYRILRLDAIAGMNAKEAIGMLVAGKTGAKEPYSRQDLSYDLRTQVIKLVSTNTADPDDPDELDKAAMAASTFISAGLRDEVNIGPPTQSEIDGVDKASRSITAQACLLDAVDDIFVDFRAQQETDPDLASHEIEINAGLVLEAMDIRVGGASYATASTVVGLHKTNPGWSKAWLLEKSTEFNKNYKSMEQLIVDQPWDLCQGFIYAAAEELKQLTAMGVFTRNGVTVKDCWALGTTPLRPSEVPTLKVTPSGELDKCKWRVAVDGSDEKEGIHYFGSSHHAAPSAESFRYWFAAEAQVPIAERCGQADVSSAYNVPGAGLDGDGNPINVFVRMMSWAHAVEIVKGKDGEYTHKIDWAWFEAYRKRLLAKQATGKKIIPEIYQRYLHPDEEVYTLTKNTYGRIAGGRIWMDYFCTLMHEAPLHFDRISTEAAWFHLPTKASETYPDANIPPGKADMQIHTDDMLIRPGNKFSWVTDTLKEKGLKLTTERNVTAHTGVKITYGTTEDGLSTCTITQEQAILKMYTEFKLLFDARRSARRTKVQVPMMATFKHATEHELDFKDKQAIAEHKAWPYRHILGHIMWICYTHPEVWYASRVLARHSQHHTKHHRDALLDCGLFLIDVAAPWGIRYVSTWTLTYLIDHPEHWHRVCNKLALGDASHCDDPVTMLCTGGGGVSGNRGLISGFCSSLKWINLSTLSSEVKVTTKIAGIVYNIQQLEEEIEMPDMEPMTLATDSRSVTQVVADPGRHRTMTTHVDRDAFKVREYVRRGRVIIRWCPGDENWSDIFTKPLANPKFTYFWHSMCGYIEWKLPDALDKTATGASAVGDTVQIDFDYWVKDVP